MDNQHKFLLTSEGLEQLKKEYDTLVKTKRPDAIKRVATARDQGDLAENSEYAAARDELSFIEGRVLELEEILRNAELITNHHSKNIVDLGSKVTLHISGKKDVYMIVGEPEANPMERKISHSSPLGKALMGRKVGDRIDVVAPVGKLSYKILAIE